MTRWKEEPDLLCQGLGASNSANTVLDRGPLEALVLGRPLAGLLVSYCESRMVLAHRGLKQSSAGAAPRAYLPLGGFVPKPWTLPKLGARILRRNVWRFGEFP